MKYRELIQFNPIDEIIKFEKLDNEDYRTNVVKNFVCSETFESYTIPTICKHLDFSRPVETKGIQIVGNYGTGKSHLMSLFSIIAEDEKYLDLLQNEKAKVALGKIAGKYLVHRFEIGSNKDLWTIVAWEIDKALDEWGIDYSLSDDKTPDSYATKIAKMMAKFEEKYPNKGFLLVIDEMLSFLKGHATPAALNTDLQVLQALGHQSDRTHFRMVFGVQELIYQSTEFQFEKDMLSHVSDRYENLTILKTDVQFIAQERLLKKNEQQKSTISDHLGKFRNLFPDMDNDFDTYVNLFPVHPSYFENFQEIRIGKSQREVLKVLSEKFAKMLDQDVPEEEPGIISYDSYWDDMKRNTDLMAIPDVRRVSDIMTIVDQKIDNNFTGGRASQKPLAHRIANALAVKILQADLAKTNGATAETLTRDLCPVDDMCEGYDDLVELAVKPAADNIVQATIGEYLERNDINDEYHLRIEGGVNYEQKIKDYASQMDNSTKDHYFFQFLAKVLPVEDETYRNGFLIWPHHIVWKSRMCTRSGYIFMGNPAAKSTTHPRRHFYIYFMPIFDAAAMAHDNEEDGVFFLLNELSDKFKETVSYYGAALQLENGADSAQKPKYETFRKRFFKECCEVFDREFYDKTNVEYNGSAQPMRTMVGFGTGQAKIDAVSSIVSVIMEPHFDHENPEYPSFSLLSQPLADDNRKNILSSARSVISKPQNANSNGIAILHGLGLWKDGRLSTSDSQYARSIKAMLDAAGGKVVNRSEILEAFYVEGNEFLSKDFHIEADLEFIVLSAMAAQGELEIVLNNSSRINATSIDLVTRLNDNDYYEFKSVCPPKGINLAVVKELMLALIEEDRTNRLGEASTYADLAIAARDISKRAVKMASEIRNGYTFAGAEILSPSEGSSYYSRFTALAGMCDQIPNYNNEAKLRNITWTVDNVRSKLVDDKGKLDEFEKKFADMEKFQAIISYLKQAQQLAMCDKPLMMKLIQGMQKLSSIIDMNDSDRTAYLRELEQIKGDYADWYLARYTAAHITEMENATKLDILSSKKYQVCEDVINANFLNMVMFTQWKNKIGQLKPANSLVTRENILISPFQDGFNPTIQSGQKPNVNALKTELDDIFADIDQQFHDALDDPSVDRNKQYLNEPEKVLIKQFSEGKIELDHTYARQLVEVIQKLNHSFERVEISFDEIVHSFSRPMTKQAAMDAFEQLILSKTSGMRPEDVRIIIKQ